MTTLPPLEAIWRAPDLVKDFDELTSLGGRLVGSSSEAASRDFLRRRLTAIQNVRLLEHRFEYSSWRSRDARLTLQQGSEALRCHPLIWSGETPVQGLEAEVVDLGRGTEADFRSVGRSLSGKIALVQHEYPFARETIHRRMKYGWSKQYHAAGFLIANNCPGNANVGGSCGQDVPDNIPAFGISHETARRVSARGARVRMHHGGERRWATAVNLVAEIPGQQREWVVVCAHYDGHDLAESALDNGTGVVAALEILRTFAPFVANCRRGLRVIFFTAEESGLLGSRHYVDSLAPAACRDIALTINLDTLAGSAKFGCLYSEYADVKKFVETVGETTGLQFDCIEPLLRNSDHYNFARRGIPALRIVAGFDDPGAGARRLLTEHDTRDLVTNVELKMGALVGAELTWAALNWPGTISAHRAERPA